MISVIIPMYNSKDTITDCINSVLNQTRADLIAEIIVIDDASKDESAILVEKNFRNNNKIQMIHNKENSGVSAARNAGIKAARSEWIALLDADDIWFPDKIEKQWEQIVKYPKIQFLGSNRNNENIHWGKRLNADLYALNLKHILIKNWPHTSTVLIRKKIFKEVGLFNEKMRYAEDAEMWNRIACKYPLFYIPVSCELAGGNKMQFGEKGLSANLKGMHKGYIHNLKMLKKKCVISVWFYLFLKFYNNVKYLRRILITYINKFKNNKKLIQINLFHDIR